MFRGFCEDWKEGLHGLQGEVFPEWGGHKRLLDSIVEQELLYLGRSKQADGDIFGSVEMLGVDFLDVGGQKCVCKVVGRTGVLRKNHELLPGAVAVAGFFQKFAACGIHGRFSLFGHSGNEFGEYIPEAMAVLFHHDEIAVGCNGDNVDPGGIFQNVVFRMDGAVGEAHSVAACREPWAPDYILAIYCFPFFDFHDIRGECFCSAKLRISGGIALADSHQM